MFNNWAAKKSLEHFERLAKTPAAFRETTYQLLPPENHALRHNQYAILIRLMETVDKLVD